MKINISKPSLCLVAFLGVMLTSNHVAADEMVRFESEPVKLSPLRERQATERGEIFTQPHGTPLIGYLSRPQGDGPFRAVVVMHGCGGLGSRLKTEVAERLVAQGYVALVIDSFATRNMKTTRAAATSSGRHPASTADIAKEDSASAMASWQRRKRSG